MNTLAHGLADGDGPGPWILLFPLMWALVVGGAVVLLRRTGWRGRAHWRRGPVDFGERAPIAGGVRGVGGGGVAYVEDGRRRARQG
ncbi:SHOCT domain-containing protein, partial [Streptomyces sp. NPDC127074]|uniref:SHOCT domain-containing protein n=1 Tax=Streptomyces sp. NPDC127074 TaxID=3347130 RepID=UPI0036680A56